MKNTLLRCFIIFVLVFSTYGCESISPEMLSFSRDIYPLIMGQLSNSTIYFSETYGLVFYTECLPYLQRPFSLFIPFSQTISQQIITPNSLTYVHGQGMNWGKYGFEAVDDTNRFVQVLRQLVRPDMEWKEFVQYLWTIQIQPILGQMSSITGASGGSLFDIMPMIFIVTVSPDGTTNSINGFFLNDLFPETQMQ